MRDRHRRLVGIEVDRRHVEREVLVDLGDQQARDARDTVTPGAARKRKRDPVAQLARRAASTRRAVQIGTVTPLRRAIERHAAAAASAADCPSTNVFSGPLNVGLDAIALDVRQRSRRPPSLNRRVAGRVVKSEKRALRAEQIGHAHRAQLGAVEPVRRKRDRHAQHGAPDAVLAEDRSRTASTCAAAGAPAAAAECGSGRASRSARPCRCGSTTASAGRCGDRDRGSRRCCAAPGWAPVLNDDHADRRERRDTSSAAGGNSPSPRASGSSGAAPLHEAVGQLRVLAVEPDDDQPIDPRPLARRPTQQPTAPGTATPAATRWR